MLKHPQDVIDSGASIIQQPGVRVILRKGLFGQHAAVGRRLGQEFRGCQIRAVPKHHSQPGFIVLQIDLPANAKHIGGVHALCICKCSHPSAPASQILMQAIEELLDSGFSNETDGNKIVGNINDVKRVATRIGVLMISL